VVVRRAGPDDIAALAAVMKAVADEDRWIATPPTATEQELRTRFSRGLEDGDLVLVLEEGGRVIGCLGLHPTAATGVWSLGMAILPDHRGRGGGRALVEEAMREAASLDIHKVELEVFPDNAAAIGLYLACGFEIEGLRRRHYRRPDGSLRSALLMAAPLERDYPSADVD
jgi:[ribosomal protein S18]-alanine N-acetyltransferase